MKTTGVKNSIKARPKHLVANNPAYDKEHSIKNGMDKDAYAYAKANTLYDIFSKYGTRQTYSGKYVSRDEPPEDIQLKQAETIRKNIQQRKAAAGRERLKAANKVPTKSGGRLFEEFCVEAAKATGYRFSVVNYKNEFLKNIYNAAYHLPYEKWLIFIEDEFKNSRYKKATLP